MIHSKILDDVSARLGEALSRNPLGDVRRNVRELVASALAQLDVVTREEYQVQVDLLASALQKLEALETRVAALEARKGAPGPASPITH